MFPLLIVTEAFNYNKENFIMALISTTRDSRSDITDKLKRVKEGLAANMTLLFSPATQSSAVATVGAGSAGFTREIVITLKNTAGDLHSWANTYIADAIVASLVSDHAAGVGVATLSLSTLALVLVGGTQTVTLTGAPGTFTTDARAVVKNNLISLGGGEFAAKSVKSQLIATA